MRLVVQRVKNASVVVEHQLVGSIDHGLLVFVGVHKDDIPENTTCLVNKLIHLRVFSDDQGKMNLNLKEVGGALLVISQFTLYGNCTGGRRPDFLEAAPGREAELIYDKFVKELKCEGVKVETGRFGAHMEIASVNDGPITLIIESAKN